MQKIKINALLIAAAISCTLFAGKASAYNDCCFGEVGAGVDFLYWQPCVNDLHYVLEGNSSFFNTTPSEVDTKYIHPDWEPGVRAYMHAENLWNSFGGGAVYTYYDASAKSSVETSSRDTLKLSNPIPELEGLTNLGDQASGKWELEYQTLDLYLSLELNASCDSCLEISSFGGLKWASFCLERTDKIESTIVPSVATSLEFERELDLWGVGPLFGLSSKYTLCDCFHLFGIFETSLLVGKVETKDFQDSAYEDMGTTTFERTYKSDDDCVCFGGLHLMTGLSYETCFCDWDVAFRLGWEYVQWLNVPYLPYYESGEDGVSSSPRKNNITLQGIFAGLNVSF